MDGPTEFLVEKYGLHNEPAVRKQAERTERQKKKRVPLGSTELLIKNYFERFAEIVNNPDQEARKHGIEVLKRVLHQTCVVQLDDVPESYFKQQIKIIIERGEGGDWNALSGKEKEDLLRRGVMASIEAQKRSLDAWIDYFSSSETDNIPIWLKYYIIRNVVSMSGYDKDQRSFSRRSRGTMQPFPELNREAIARVLEKYMKDSVTPPSDGDDTVRFARHVTIEDFAPFYARVIEEMNAALSEEFRCTDGKWVKYDKDSDPRPLVDSIIGQGTGWCTVSEDVAKEQLKGGDFYIYYSLDKNGNPTIPRVAIRIENGQIAEVRGVGSRQNLDQYIGDIVREKLEEFPDGNLYQKKVANMETLTRIHAKTKNNQDLTREDLVFLYQIEGGIVGFGHEKDPRIKEILEARNPEEDVPIIFQCSPSEIAHNEEEVNKDTKIYIGPLSLSILRNKNLERIYTSFPEGRVEREVVAVGGKSLDSLKEALEEDGFWLCDRMKALIEGHCFVVNDEQPEIQMQIVTLRVCDLGILGKATTREIKEKVDNLGLSLCPPEVIFRYAEKHNNQLINRGVWLIPSSAFCHHKSPLVFEAAYYWLSGFQDSYGDDGLWDPNAVLIFNTGTSSW